ncbi:Uncharacterised protein [Mycobacteroides abscessus subsp. abscessus]|nr:Uncharacterised protein [Mycobacteroides abscessus subsp. abscessus]
MFFPIFPENSRSRTYSYSLSISNPYPALPRNNQEKLRAGRRMHAKDAVLLQMHAAYRNRDFSG